MTDVVIRRTSSPVDSLAMASTDQQTVLGNGTAEFPLRLGPTSGGSAGATGDTQFVAQFSGTRVLGAPAYVTGGVPTVGISQVGPASAASSGLAEVVGVVSALQVGAAVTVRVVGEVELTTSQWDAVTGQSGGLTPGRVYYLSTVAGHLTTTAPSAGGTFRVAVGTAISATRLLLSENSYPVAN